MIAILQLGREHLIKLDQTIQQHLEKLLLSLQGEVLDYVLYLEQKA